jgi:transcriptional antiterminator RfaH
LFKDYCFARFDAAIALKRVQHARGVSCVVHFGSYRPTIADPVIDELRTAMGIEDLCVLDDLLQSGDSVQINSGPLLGLHAVVTRVLPAKQRVAVLLDFLGRQTETELARDQVEPNSETQWLPRAIGSSILTEATTLC